MSFLLAIAVLTVGGLWCVILYRITRAEPRPDPVEHFERPVP